jgi:hypothetical protein
MFGVTRAGQRPYDHQATGGQLGEPIAYEMAQSPLDLVADDGTAHSLAHDETRTRRGGALPRRVRVRCAAAKVDDEKWAACPASPPYRSREVLAPPQPILGRQHVMPCTRSGGQVGATLATAVRQDGAAGTGTHAQAETVGLRATTVVRLEGALAHSGAPEMIRRRRDIAWLSPCAHEKLAFTPVCTASQSQIVIFAHRRQAAAAIDNSTWLRYARLRHPVKPALGRGPLCTGCGQQLEPRGSP